MTDAGEKTHTGYTHTGYTHTGSIQTGRIHIGKHIRECLERNGQSVAWLARQLSYSRTNVYKIFDKASVDTGVLMRVSEILRFDFFSLYSERLREKHI